MCSKREVKTMSQYTLRIPENLHRRAVKMAREQGVSLNQFFLYAITSMVSGLERQDFFEKRLTGKDEAELRKAFRGILERVPDNPPEPGDEL